MLYHLALAVYPPRPLSDADIGNSDTDLRDDVSEHLRRVLTEGLELAPHERSEAMRDLLVARDFATDLTIAVEQWPRQVEVLMDWLKTREGRDAARDTIAELMPRLDWSDQKIKAEGRTYGLDSATIDRVLERRMLFPLVGLTGF